jgi:hypothetical protein
MPAKYARAYSKGQKNDFRDAEAIAEAVQRPTMKFVATKTPDQLDCRVCTGCANGWSGSAPASSIRFVPSCWNAVLQYARVYAFCGPNCQSSLPSALTRCHHAWCASSRSWRATGGGLTSASKACRLTVTSTPAADVSAVRRMSPTFALNVPTRPSIGAARVYQVSWTLRLSICAWSPRTVAARKSVPRQT